MKSLKKKQKLFKVAKTKKPNACWQESGWIKWWCNQIWQSEWTDKHNINLGWSTSSVWFFCWYTWKLKPSFGKFLFWTNTRLITICGSPEELMEHVALWRKLTFASPLGQMLLSTSDPWSPLFEYLGLMGESQILLHILIGAPRLIIYHPKFYACLSLAFNCNFPIF